MTYYYGYKPASPQASCPRFGDINSAVPGLEVMESAPAGGIKLSYPEALSAYSKGTLDDAMAENGYVTLPDDPIGAADKRDRINARTRELIQMGFEWPPASGQRFSLSDAAQRNLSELDSLRDSGLVTYPFNMSTIDDTPIYAVPDSATLHNMYLTGLGRVQWSYGTGNALKAAVNAATTRAEVDAVTDSR